MIERIAEPNPHLYQRDVEAIVNAILDTITTALAQGDRVELRGFGVVAVKKRDARTGRNPRNGTKVAVPDAWRARPGCRIGGHAAVTLITPCRARDQSPTGVLQASQYRAGNPARSVPGPVRKPEKNIDGATPPCSTGLPVQTTQPIFPQPGK